MPRGEMIIRQWRLLQMLQRRLDALPLDDLANDLEVSKRTLQRDLGMLQEVGFPIEFCEDEVGKRYWRLPHTFIRSAPLVLTLTEAVSLHLARHLFAPLAGTPFAAGLNDLLQKIQDHIPKTALEHFRELDQTFYVRRLGLTDYTPHANAIECLALAARENRQVTIAYQSLWRGESYKTAFHPYGLVYFEGDLFAVGFSQRANATRVLKLSRVRHVTPTEQAFQRPTDFNLANYFQNTFGIVQQRGKPTEIEVLFHGPAAALVEERIWHESQRAEWLPAEPTLFEPEPHNQEILRARFRLANFVEFKRWLKGFGEMAEVVRPAWLRDELREELLAAARLYQP